MSFRIFQTRQDQVTIPQNSSSRERRLPSQLRTLLLPPETPHPIPPFNKRKFFPPSSSSPSHPSPSHPPLPASTTASTAFPFLFSPPNLFFSYNFEMVRGRKRNSEEAIGDDEMYDINTYDDNAMLYVGTRTCASNIHPFRDFDMLRLFKRNPTPKIPRHGLSFAKASIDQGEKPTSTQADDTEEPEIIDEADDHERRNKRARQEKEKADKERRNSSQGKPPPLSIALPLDIQS